MASTRDERFRRPRLVGAFVNLGLGLLFLAMAFSRPTITNMRLNDLVTLLAAGACLGMGLVALVLYLVDRRTG
jgi:hypothetical protein